MNFTIILIILAKKCNVAKFWDLIHNAYMSGHNKWSKIKHKKAATDAQKSREFAKVVRMIQIEAKKCGGNESAPGLRTAIEKARSINMPKDNIDRAIKKASEFNADLKLQLYEGYGPGGVVILISVLSDNTNRTSQEIRHTFSRFGYALGGQGSVAWNFTKDDATGDWVPNTFMDISDTDLESLSTLVEALEENDDVQDIYTNAE